MKSEFNKSNQKTDKTMFQKIIQEIGSSIWGGSQRFSNAWNRQCRAIYFFPSIGEIALKVPMVGKIKWVQAQPAPMLGKLDEGFESRFDGGSFFGEEFLVFGFDE